MKNRGIYQVTSIILCLCLLVMLYCFVKSEIRQIGYRDGQLAAYQAYSDGDLPPRTGINGPDRDRQRRPAR